MTFIDLFSGIGGFLKGLELSGMRCLGHCEKDKYADKSYRAMFNIKECEWYGKDIKTVQANEIPYTDLWCAGFPCQDISVAGQRKGFEGERSSLFFEIIRLLKGKNPKDRPKWIVLENVRNLLSVNKGWDFTRVCAEMAGLGYDIEYGLLNTKNFGLPHNRLRIFIIAYRHIGKERGLKIFPVRASNGKNLIRIISGKQGQRVYDSSGISTTLMSSGGGFGSKTGLYPPCNDCKTSFIDLNKNPKTTDVSRCIKARYNNGITKQTAHNSGVIYTCDEACAVLTPDRKNKRQNGRRIKIPGESAFCLTGQDRHGIYLCGKIRRLTPRECFRLQGFSDEMFNKAQAVNSDSQLYKQAGNAVSIPVVTVIGNQIMKVNQNKVFLHNEREKQK